MQKIWVVFLLFLSGSLTAAEREIALVIRPDFIGEYSFAYRIQAACKNLGWSAEIISLENWKDLALKKYDFAIHLVPDSKPHPGCLNYLAIFDPLNHYFDKKKFLRKKYKTYDGYLLTYPMPRFARRKSFLDQRRFPFMRWYPLVQKREYRKNEPSFLFHVGSTWGNRFFDEKFRQLNQLLDQEPYVKIYGNGMLQELSPNRYQGNIPVDSESLYETMSEAGVVLILHNQDHNRYQLPSGRIFEAAAASMVVLCDQNDFVKKEFGDSVLYIDTSQDAASILNQIRSHMNWIQTHKQEALEKAKKAYEIYQEKFLLEHQLIRLERFHEKISQRKKPVLSLFKNFIFGFFSKNQSAVSSGKNGTNSRDPESMPLLHSHQ